MSTSTTTPQPPPPASVLFARGVIAQLATWPALRIAVDQSWGGPNSAEKRTWLASVLLDDFEEQTNPPPDVDYVEDRLLQVLEDEFETVLEDDSAREIAQEIVKLWQISQAGGPQAVEIVKGLEEKADKLKGKKVQAEEGATNDSDWEDESGSESEGGDNTGEAPALLDHSQRSKPEPEVDEDGFTAVKGKGKSHR
ncbi:hypothetical protein QCA50_016155 [Cerrena zonata]|uniref:Pre-rRNA-processing protein TSR2 n=1 Tax=Cerrena zonata TaxID=2478898 RepID=A0AAW0FVW3_9APHY